MFDLKFYNFINKLVNWYYNLNNIERKILKSRDNNKHRFESEFNDIIEDGNVNLNIKKYIFQYKLYFNINNIITSL